jgi:hypothetical protein
MKVHYRHLSLSPARSIQFMPPSHYSKIHFNIIFPTRSRSFKWSLSLRFSHYNRACTSTLLHTCHMPSPSQSSWFYHPNDIWWRVFHVPNFIFRFRCSGRTEGSVRIRCFCDCFVTWLSSYSNDFSARRPAPKLEDHPLSAVRDCLFNTFATILHIWRPFLHPQPQDASRRGDRHPLIMGNKIMTNNLSSLPAKCQSHCCL